MQFERSLLWLVAIQAMSLVSNAQGQATYAQDGYGFRSMAERPQASDSQQYPAVVSSSYHRAVVNNWPEPSNQMASPHVDVPVQEVALGHSESPLGIAPIGVNHQATHSLGSSSGSHLPMTPLSPPRPSSTETKTQGKSGIQMLLSVGSSLMMVIGIFLGCTWLYRKSLGGNKGSGLPRNVVQVLGRTPVATRQQLVLLRFGSKLVLVSMVQGETRTISEITDPLEVDRLAGLCESHQPGSISSSFREVLTQGVRA